MTKRIALAVVLGGCGSPGSDGGSLGTLGGGLTTATPEGSTSGADPVGTSTSGSMTSFTAGSTAPTSATTFPPGSSDESTGEPLPPLPCDDTFIIDPADPTLDAIYVEVSHPDPLPYVDLSAAGPNQPTISFIDVVGSKPYAWAWEITGHVPGVYTLAFGNRADEAAPVVQHSTCQIRVESGGTTASGGGSATGNGDCSCADKSCGEDDGCGTPCSGGHRDANGAVSDCRLEGNCGCGVEPNDNMQCTGDGLCRVRCSCDCLPPIDKTPAEVAGLDFGGSCALVFEESGDSTVWDYANGVPLCPLDYDPEGAARCTECPPCHRPQAPECDWAQYCTCTAPMYYAEYQQTCCNAGPEYCY
ncbi:MAG: hypothetical protein AAGA54_12030 [Myxococcota bacterium]